MKTTTETPDNFQQLSKEAEAKRPAIASRVGRKLAPAQTQRAKTQSHAQKAAAMATEVIQNGGAPETFLRFTHALPREELQILLLQSVGNMIESPQTGDPWDTPKLASCFYRWRQQVIRNRVAAFEETWETATERAGVNTVAEWQVAMLIVHVTTGWDPSKNHMNLDSRATLMCPTFMSISFDPIPLFARTKTPRGMTKEEFKEARSAQEEEPRYPIQVAGAGQETIQLISARVLAVMCGSTIASVRGAHRKAAGAEYRVDEMTKLFNPNRPCTPVIRPANLQAGAVDMTTPEARVVDYLGRGRLLKTTPAAAKVNTLRLAEATVIANDLGELTREATALTPPPIDSISTHPEGAKRQRKGQPAARSAKEGLAKIRRASRAETTSRSRTRAAPKNWVESELANIHGVPQLLTMPSSAANRMAADKLVLAAHRANLQDTLDKTKELFEQSSAATTLASRGETPWFTQNLCEEGQPLWAGCLAKTPMNIDVIHDSPLRTVMEVAATTLELGDFLAYADPTGASQAQAKASLVAHLGRRLADLGAGAGEHPAQVSVLAGLIADEIGKQFSDLAKTLATQTLNPLWVRCIRAFCGTGWTAPTHWATLVANWACATQEPTLQQAEVAMKLNNFARAILNEEQYHAMPAITKAAAQTLQNYDVFGGGTAEVATLAQAEQARAWMKEEAMVRGSNWMRQTFAWGFTPINYGAYAQLFHVNSSKIEAWKNYKTLNIAVMSAQAEAAKQNSAAVAMVAPTSLGRLNTIATKAEEAIAVPTPKGLERKKSYREKIREDVASGKYGDVSRPETSPMSQKKMLKLREILPRIPATFTQILDADHFIELFITTWVQAQISGLYTPVMTALMRSEEVREVAELVLPELTDGAEETVDWEAIGEVISGVTGVNESEYGATLRYLHIGWVYNPVVVLTGLFFSALPKPVEDGDNIPTPMAMDVALSGLNFRCADYGLRAKAETEKVSTAATEKLPGLLLSPEDVSQRLDLMQQAVLAPRRSWLQAWDDTIPSGMFNSPVIDPTRAPLDLAMDKLRDITTKDMHDRANVDAQSVAATIMDLFAEWR